MSHGHLVHGFVRSPRMQNQQVDQFDAGLCSIQGAKTIISIIKRRRFVSRLIIGHNDLGNDGCRVLFDFLCSQAGQRYEIQEISLNSNGVGDEGLLAIGRYLRDNKHLKELFLQNNNLSGAPDVVVSFTAALNSSRLQLLSLTTNKDLGDGFLASFLPALDAPHLREVHLSAIGLTTLSGPVICSYLASSRCRLHVLRCNGNSLGLRAIKPVLLAIRGHNYSLRSVEFYANQLQDDGMDSAGSGWSTPEEAEGDAGNDMQLCHLRSWKDCDCLLSSLLLRNTHLKREVARQSLALLSYSRPLLLQSKLQRLVTEGGNPHQRIYASSLVLVRKDNNTMPHFPFKLLPPELQLYIFSFISPSLSTGQRIRIYNYASSAETLPQLLPPFSTLARCIRVTNGAAHIPDPSSIESTLGGTVWPLQKKHSPFSSSCTVDQDLGSTYAHYRSSDKQRLQFLEAVRCDTYELESGEEACGARELYTLSIC